jgi:nucleotide-binding universal stress UspA family protein
VERFAVDLVVLPASMERPSLVDRVRGNTVERFRAALPVPVLVAGAGHEIATELAAAAR